METGNIKKFAQNARRQLLSEVGAKLKTVLADGSLARRENPAAIQVLENDITLHGKTVITERVAYTWFNRFSALRFMDVNHYNAIGIVSPAPGQTQPEILAEAKMGHIDTDIPVRVKQEVLDLLTGNKISKNPQQKAYKLLFIAYCNLWNETMPFLFERIQDYTELLLPDDLLSDQSVLMQMLNVLTAEVCQDVEVIGWLYQFYISEKKDEVFDGLKKNQKVTPENIPAATQLFTPNWIVRYLVENSLGRLWMLNHPDSKLIDQMAYYIEPEQPEKDYIKINSPEEIRICDPACGSGHMLVYAFDLLYQIYTEEGYNEVQIPELILTKNLFGIEIDKRAGELAAFALTMKARSRQRRFFRKQIQPNICVLENVTFEPGELKAYMGHIGQDLFTMQLQNTLHQFEEADNFGSLIRPDLTDVEPMLQFINAKGAGSDLFLNKTHQKVLQVLAQAEYLRPKYHVVVANPPYMGSGNMNGRLSSWIKDNYPDYKSDLFSAFIVRNTELAVPRGQLGFMSPYVWMFISSHEKLRQYLIKQKTITSLIQLEYSGFDGATVPICTFTLQNSYEPGFKGGYIKLSDFRGSERQGPKTLEAIRNPDCGWFYRASASNFEKIPGSPIAYWVSGRLLNSFEQPQLDTWAPVKQGLATADNNRFLRIWAEVSITKIGFNYRSIHQTNDASHRWFPYNKGGSFRKWHGNKEFLVLWENDGLDIRNFADETGYIRSRAQNTDYYFKPGVTWTFVSSSKFGVRYTDTGFIFDVAGSSAFPPAKLCAILTGFLSSKLSWSLLKALNPTLNFQVGNISSLPISEKLLMELPTHIVDRLIRISRSDWDSYETSWDFQSLPILQPAYYTPSLSSAYQSLRAHWQSMTDEMLRLEEENNRIFIEAYGLEDELTPDVPIEEITLTCNPYYRYGNNKSSEELEALLLADTMREYISYAVGCMFGRYSLDKPGLVLANQGDTLQEYLAQVPVPSFMPDSDNVIPILDGEWFTDDIVERFKEFLRITFGREHYEENLAYIESAIGKDIRKYFLKDFYTDHVKRYKKRPIYWLFTSPRGTFNALIYMHRYRPDTISVVLNKYLREFKVKLNARLDQLRRVEIDSDASKADKARAIKAIDALRKDLDELELWERDVIFPLAVDQIEIDLDDGVKVNYPKFGTALKKIPGLEAKED
ncbi:MAG: BREX-1 system adenine-specific DNA-methyltransferase PglX [Spirochaetales bacterium]|nr:BREX-1 system adenine-specific DNA-methyltransferase PglX [Spirochaetales bacterium]